MIEARVRKQHSMNIEGKNYLKWKNKFKLISWNINGLSYSSKNILLSQQETHKWDVIALQETHNNWNGSIPKNWHIINSEIPPKNDKFSGTCIIIKNKKYVINDGKKGSRICWVRLNGKSKNYVIVSAYLPHSQRSNPSFQDTICELDNLLTYFNHNFSNDCLIICGDFNCKVARNTEGIIGRWNIHKSSNDNGKEFTKFLRTNGLCLSSTFFCPKKNHTNCTYKKGNSFGQIDFICVSKRYKTDVKKCTVNWDLAKLKYGKKKNMIMEQ